MLVALLPLALPLLVSRTVSSRGVYRGSAA